MKNTLRTLCWAIYLGCSWTWCIGMFLPVILVSEFGNIAWFVFAIPNVLGAAAMGWTLSKPGSSEKIVSEHRAACVAFSAVTLAFHLFFLYWMCSSGMIPILYARVAVITGIALGVMGRRQIKLDFFLAVAVLVISLGVLCKGLQHQMFGVDTAPNEHHIGAMLGLAPICILGFALCPYLDLTFHRARQQTAPCAGKMAFGIGFGLVFLPMIVLTMLYAGDFAGRHYWYDDQWGGSFSKPFFLTWVSLHIAAQIGFTFAAHLRALPKARTNDLWMWLAAAGLVGLSIFAMHQQKWFDQQFSGRQMLTGELIYRLFMSFYGLVFPAYVWICMVPLRGRSPGVSRRSMMAMCVAIAIASPMFWMGFINARTIWLIPGVAVVLVARALVPSNVRTELQS